MAAGKTAKSILISCGARLAPVDIEELRELTEYDEMELDKIGERKTIMFMIMSDTDGTFNFILAIMQSQMFNLLCDSLHDIALHNLAESKIEFRTMSDVLIDMMFPDGIREDDPMMFMLPPEEENPSMYVLSNGDKLNEAAAILDGRTMEDISEKLGGDFIILPSIHECIVLPVNKDFDQHYFENMVQDVNTSQVAPQERLSDHVYMYDSVEKELILADKMPERLQLRAEAQKDMKEAEKTDRHGKTEQGEKKPERSRVSMKAKLAEKKAEAAKNEASREVIPAKRRETALE